MRSAQLRILKLVGESGLWKTVGKAHTWLYRATGGKVGYKAGKLTNLLLTTTGRKSGALRTVALHYMADGDTYVIVASNGGSDHPPAWWLNLQKTPHVTVQVGNLTTDVVAGVATPEEHARLWPKLKELNPFYGRYEQITDREIPVVVLRPARPKTQR